MRPDLGPPPRCGASPGMLGRDCPGVERCGACPAVAAYNLTADDYAAACLAWAERADDPDALLAVERDAAPVCLADL